MRDEAQRLRIAARWGYRSYEAEAGRYSLFSDLLREMYSCSVNRLAMMALESWDVTREDFSARFDIETPVLYTDIAHLNVFRAIALIRDMNEHIAASNPLWGQRHALSFMHFILGSGARKHAFIVDLTGVPDLAAHEARLWSGDTDPDVSEADRIRPPVIQVQLPGKRISCLRQANGRLVSLMESMLNRSRSKLPKASVEVPAIAKLSDLVAGAAGSAVMRDDFPAVEMAEALRLFEALQHEVNRDLRDMTVAVRIARWVGQQELTEADPLAIAATDFLRQAFLQAVLAPRIDGCSVAVVIPDMSHTVSAAGNEIGSAAPEAIEASSLAVQYFPRGTVCPSDPEFSFWAAMISIVGRGKTVHDFSILERERGMREGANAERVRMASVLHAVSHHDLENLDARVGGAIGALIDDWNNLPETARLGRLREIRANARLALMGAGLDCLWEGPDSQLDRDYLFKLKQFLEPAIVFRRKRVILRGDWDENVLVPLSLMVVFANLIRNAINTAGNSEIELEAAVGDDAVEFVCRSEKPMPAQWREKAFAEAQRPEVPDRHRGLWICRQIVTGLCRGEWSLAEETDTFKTNIRFSVPFEGRSIEQ
jgi:hypothetical protein